MGVSATPQELEGSVQQEIQGCAGTSNLRGTCPTRGKGRVVQNGRVRWMLLQKVGMDEGGGGDGGA